MAGTGLDVSVRKRAEQSLRKVNAELARKNADIEQLLYTVSHDLKSPLVTIQGFLGLLGSDAKAARLDRVLDYSQRVQNAANRMGRLLDDLLNFNRIGRVANEPVSINLTELVREVVSSHAQELASTKISVGVQEDMPVIVGDKHRLHQVLDNLLVNAIKYGSGADRPLIEIGGRQENEEMRVFVKDNGKGIAPEYHKRVFDLFHCLESNKGGTGVGLAIVKKIVEVHGGRAWVESTPGAGATFWLSFPAKKEPQGGGISES
jgi:signal transduction histidine kinase